MKSCFESFSIDEAISCWKEGGLVAIPTETVYGLAAPINDLELVKKIFSYKERPFYDPLIVHVSDLEMAKRYGNFEGLSEKLAQAFWPGPLTLVVEKTDLVDDIITSGLETVGLRCPNNKTTLELIKKIDEGVPAPSANKFTKTSPTLYGHVLESFKENFLCVLRSQEESSDVGIESTIVKVNGKEVQILRPGMITSCHIKECLAGEDISISYGQTAVEETENARMAPGQESVHYRPEYKLFLCREESGALVGYEDYEPVLLNSDPLVSAREIYLKLRASLKGHKGRVFIFPKEIKLLSQEQQEQWLGIENRLEKAGEWIR